MGKYIVYLKTIELTGCLTLFIFVPSGVGSIFWLKWVITFTIASMNISLIILSALDVYIVFLIFQLAENLDFCSHASILKNFLIRHVLGIYIFEGRYTILWNEICIVVSSLKNKITIKNIF